MKKMREIRALRLRAIHFQSLGIDQFFITPLLSYRSAAEKLVEQIEDPELKKKEKARMDQVLLEFGQAIYAAPAPPIIDLWAESKGGALKKDEGKGFWE